MIDCAVFFFGKKTVIIAGTRRKDNSNGKGDQASFAPPVDVEPDKNIH